VIGVIGLGYVGLPLAIQFARSGNQVVGFDVNEELVEQLTLGRSQISGVSHDSLTAAQATSLSLGSSPSDLAKCSTFVICVPTPLSVSGGADTSRIEQAVEAIAPWMRKGSMVILESTSYPGTTEEIVAAPLAAMTGLRAGSDFCVGFSPERIDPGNPNFRVGNTPKIVSGIESCCLNRASELYSEAGISVVNARGVREAEFAKLLENTYRQVNIALVNELAKFAPALGVNLREAIRLAATKPFGFEPFFPGPGVGGHCIPIDPQYLASRIESRLGEPLRFVALAREINAEMPTHVVSRLVEEMVKEGITVVGSLVLLLGVTYKRDVPDMRETPAEEIVRLLRMRGVVVSYFDPFVEEWDVDGNLVTRIEQFPVGSPTFDGMVLVTDHSTFLNRDYSGVARVCLDTRGVLEGDGIAQL